MGLQKELTMTTLTRSPSLADTEMSSATSSDSERELSMMVMNDNSSMKNNSSSSGSKRSRRRSTVSLGGLRRRSSIAEVSTKDLLATLDKERRSCLAVKTQKQSLTQSLDEQLANSKSAIGVSFGQLCIREYGRRMGDNPGCRVGVSLTIDWEVQSEVTIGLEEYESTRSKRRDRSELNIPPEVRMQMMRDSGFSRGEILQYVKLANIARGQRSRTNETLQLAGAQEFAQRLFRGVVSKTVGRGKKKQEKLLLQESIEKDQKMSELRRSLTPASSSVWERQLSSLEEEETVLNDDKEEEEEEPAPLEQARPRLEHNDSLRHLPAVALDTPVACEIEC